MASDLEDQYAAIQNYWANLNRRVHANTEIVRRDTMPISQLLHVTLDKKPVYVPRIGHRQANTEDRTVPRITAADTLAGCIIAHGEIDIDSLFPPHRRNENYLNGFSIRSFSFDVALKPNPKMVYDQRATNEHWLVPYDKDHHTYPSELIGQFYVPSVKVEVRPSKLNDLFMTIRVRARQGLWMTKSEHLDPGYYEVEFLLNHKSTYDQKVVSITPISQAQYRDTAGLVLSPLSISNDIISRWSA